MIVADNGSTDGSAELADAAGARVVHEPRRGYGSAYLAGFAAARGDYIVMADADLTYDFDEIPRFVEQLDEGAELVMGNRMDNIQPGAMPWLHRYIGNPLLSGFLNLLYRTGVRDAHCGMRALRRDVLPALDLRSTGMEFASEMVIRAAKAHLDIREFPIEYHPRGGESKLSTLPRRLAAPALPARPQPDVPVPGPGRPDDGSRRVDLVAVLAQLNVFGRTWDLHTMIAGALLTIVGTQVVTLGLAARAYGVYLLGETRSLVRAAPYAVPARAWPARRRACGARRAGSQP